MTSQIRPLQPTRPLRLGEQLLAKGLITQDQLDIAVTERSKVDKPIGKVITDLGFVSDSTMREVLSEVIGNDSIDLSKIIPEKAALDLIPKNIAQKHSVMPVTYDKQTHVLLIATTDTLDLIVLERIRAALHRDIEIKPVLSTEVEIRHAIDLFYGYELSVNEILKEIGTGEIDYNALEADGGEYSHRLARLVNAILADSVKKDASDIHFEPEENFLRLRYRIDGVLRQIRSLHKDYWSAIVVRLKVMAGMNIAETRSPQDGRISLRISGKPVDFRVSTQPITHGENIVLRVLDRSKGIVPLEQLQMQFHSFQLLKLLMNRPEGIILVTGPTGSGKTTTLYSMLNFKSSSEVNIMTLEDPVEYPMDMIRQTSLNDVSKMDFVSGIRSLMRQDPDIILVGEVRDEATAEMAFRAAMTGHQVYTTLHTNSALGAFARLKDIGVKPEIMEGNIIGIIGQRLIRVLCSHCKQEKTTEEYEQVILGLKEPTTIYTTQGCDHCDHTGFKGRVSIIEVLQVNSELDHLIAHNATMVEMQQKAKQMGFKTMADDGIARIIAGETTIEELNRVVDLTSRLNPNE